MQMTPLVAWRELSSARPDIDDAVDGDETVSTEDDENIYMSDDEKTSHLSLQSPVSI